MSDLSATPTPLTLSALTEMEFPQRLAALRKDRSLTQQQLADQIGIHVTQLRRYEAGRSQPTLDVLRKLATSLSVSADVLLFDRDERGPSDDLRLQFEAINRLDPAEREILKAVIESVLFKHNVRQQLTA